MTGPALACLQQPQSGQGTRGQMHFQKLARAVGEPTAWQQGSGRALHLTWGWRLGCPAPC